MTLLDSYTRQVFFCVFYQLCRSCIFTYSVYSDDKNVYLDDNRSTKSVSSRSHFPFCVHTAKEVQTYLPTRARPINTFLFLLVVAAIKQSLILMILPLTRSKVGTEFVRSSWSDYAQYDSDE